MATSNLLPSGFLSTSGSQIVGPTGTPVRIDAIGWAGADGLGTLSGLNNASYTAIIDTIKADGFNTIRIAWSDASLNTVPSSSVSQGLNPSLVGLTNLQIFQKVVDYAGQIGLKVMFDHHTDEGGENGWGGQQGNGLWFDSGPGSNGTDGDGNTGTVTAAKFLSDWETLVKAVAPSKSDPHNTPSDPAVIGFDLDNEPLVDGNNSGGSPVNWGNGGPTDILAMYDQVGSALEGIDPGALIIAEGPQSWAGTLLNGQSGIAPDGDLTLAGSRPVVLTSGSSTIKNKVVYSDHEYPADIGGEPHDSGTAYVQQMNTDWGYLEVRHTAPVWTGEMGASLDGSDGSSDQTDETNWANTIIPYLNGSDGRQSGPTFSGNQQPGSTDWWAAGYFPGGSPDGYFTSWSGDPIPTNTAQQRVVSQLAPVMRFGFGSTAAAAPDSSDTTNAQFISGDIGSAPLPTDFLHILANPGAKFSVSGSNDVIGVAPLVGDVNITDAGQGTHFTINGPGAHVTIADFQRDSNAHVTFTNSLGYGTVQAAVAAATPDGSGGLIVGNVDFAGDSSLSPSQISIART